MTQEEKELRLQRLNERQLALKAEIQKGDEHALKCMKIGEKYADRYPEEYQVYCVAIAEYNENEKTIADTEAIEVEEMFIEEYIENL